MNAIRPLRQRPASAFADLSFGGQLSVWALRLWFSADRGYPALHQTIRTGFAKIGLPEAYTALHSFLTILVHIDRSIFSACSSNTGPLTTDERLFLAFLADQQQGAVVAAYQKLTVWTGAADIRGAMASSLEYATLLSGKNLKAAVRETPVEVAPAAEQCACRCKAHPAAIASNGERV